MSARFDFKWSQDELEASFAAMEAPIREAATAAVKEAADLAKSRGRSNIASAGFGQKWQNALRADVYPKGRTSVNAAAWVYHKIPYAIVFEEGATIRGRPTLWLPLSNIAGERVGGDGRRRVSAKAVTQRYGQILFPINRSGQKPLLAVKVRGGYNGGPVSAGLLSRALKRGERIGRNSGVRLQTVPLFVGVDSVNIRKRFDLFRVFNEVAGLLPDLYAKNLKVN